MHQIIELIDQDKLNWSYSDFDEKAAPYLTSDFRSAIRHAKGVGDRFDIMDGDLFAGGGQGIVHRALAGPPMGPSPSAGATTAVWTVTLKITDGSRPMEA